MFEIAKENGRWDLKAPEDFVKASGLDRHRSEQARHATSPKRAWEMIDAGIKAAGMLQDGHSAAGFEGVRHRHGIVDRALDSDFSFNPFASRNPISRYDFEKAKRGEYSRLVDLEGEVRGGAVMMYDHVLVPEAARRLGVQLDESEMAKTKPLHELSDVQFTRLFAEHARGMDAIKVQSRLIDVRDNGAEYQDTVVSSALRKYLGTDGIESREDREGRITPKEAKDMLHIARNIGYAGQFDAEPGIASMAEFMPNVGQPIRDYNEASRKNGGYSHGPTLNVLVKVAEADLKTWPERFGDLHRERLRQGEERMNAEGLAYNPAGVPGANVPFGFSERKEANLFGRPQEGRPQPFEAAVTRGAWEMTSAFVNENGEKKISVAISSLLKSARGESQSAPRSASKGVRIEERGAGLEAQAAALAGARGR